MSNTNPFHPWKPPFSYNRDGQWIEDMNGERMLDIRGWGWLTGRGICALKMDEEAAAKIQDDMGVLVARLLNEHHLQCSENPQNGGKK